MSRTNPVSVPSGSRGTHGLHPRRDSDSPLSPLRSPLFWRITTVVFLCIVIIEAVLLVFSWFGERDRLLTRIDDSLALLSPIVSVSEDYQELDSLVGYSGQAGQNHGQHHLMGYIIETNWGIRKSGGDVHNLDQMSLQGPQRRFDSESGVYDSVMLLSPADASLTVTLWYRVDAVKVVEELRQYVVRILGLVVLISLFVTVGCLLGLTPLLIRPLQKLDQLMRTGQRNGLRQIALPGAQMQRKDELGNVYRSFDKLTQALIRAEDENAAMTERFQGFADLGADSFWETDRHMTMTHAAGDMAGMLGISSDELVGLRLPQLAARIADLTGDFRGVFASLKYQGVWEGQLVHRPSATMVRTVRIVARALTDDHGRFRGVRGTMVDISFASELAAELKYQATHDSLTGLYNRREFDRRLTLEMATQEADGKSICICMLDLDRFKIVNDNCGHAAGDDLLKQLAVMIKSAVREQDLVARHGGDEFTVLLLDCTLEEGVRLAETICQLVSEFRFQWEERVYKLGVSIGIAEVLPTTGDGNTALIAADACCIKAKNKGRNQVQAYSPDDEVVALQHGEMQWVARISRALEEDRLLLFQQPIVPLGNESDDEIHCEILVRLQASDGKVHLPGEFLPAAERYNLVGKIDRWVVGRVISWLDDQLSVSDQALCVNVNVSGMSVSDESFQDYLRESLRGSSVSAHHLCIEITESAAMLNSARTIEFLNEIRDIGCRVALDDFGSGFSSLSQIKQLPLDYIKIDGLFIQGMVDSRLDRALVRGVAEFASILEVKTVAEYVESDSVCQMLREMRIDYAQGYLFGKPAPLAELTDRLNQRQSAA